MLFARSLEDNIAYGLPTWSKDDIIKAAQMANAHQFISEMSNKYDTEAGEKGTQLSGEYCTHGCVTVCYCPMCTVHQCTCML